VRQTLRLKAWRDTQQLVEYLILLKARRGLTTAQLQQFVADHVNITTQVRQQNDDDAGTLEVSQVNPADWESLRRSAAALLKTP
jgi:hypothetical protein